MTSSIPFLSFEQIQRFQEDGFLAVPQISPPQEVATLKTILYRLFKEKAGWEQGAQFDMVGTDDGQAPLASPQIIDPVAFAPELKETEFRQNALAAARDLLGQDAQCSYEHAIYKPARFGSATPWHQDEAFRRATEMDYDAVSVWMPLQDVAESNGCLEFIPGSHRGEILSHRSPNNDPRIHALECDGDFNRSAAVRCPMLAGAATIHHSRTLHAAGPNTSDSDRCAYVLTFKAPRARVTEPRDFPWNAEKQTARLRRREDWRQRGGFLGRLSRKLKSLLAAQFKP